MSGGHFNYAQYRIQDIISEIEYLIETNNVSDKDRFGEVIGNFFSDETIKKFKHAIIVLDMAEKLTTRIDWLISGDISEETFHERWNVLRTLTYEN